MNFTNVLQLVVSFSLLNVWLLRYNKATSYRGGSSGNLKSEFAAYGLPTWFHYFIGSLKIFSAFALIVGLWVAPITYYAALTITFLMIGALLMHFKIRDPLRKSVPALLMLIMSFTLLMTSSSV